MATRIPAYESTPERSFMARLVELLAATDRFVTWYGAHRAWPANEPPRVEPRPRERAASRPQA